MRKQNIEAKEVHFSQTLALLHKELLGNCNNFFSFLAVE